MLLGESSIPLLRELERAGVLQRDQHERLLIKPPVRQIAVDLARGSLGERAYREAAVSLAARCREAGAYEGAVEALLAGDEPAAAAAILAEHGEAILAQSDGARLSALIEQLGGAAELPAVSQLETRAQAIDADQHAARPSCPGADSAAEAVDDGVRRSGEHGGHAEPTRSPDGYREKGCLC